VKRAISVLLSVVLASAVLLASGILYLEDCYVGNCSWSGIVWHWNFEREMAENGEVKIGELVAFKWNRVYFLEPYTQLFSVRDQEMFADSIWMDSRYHWTIAYTRDGQAPFFIRMNAWRWQLGWSHPLWTADPNASFRLAQPGTGGCLPKLGRCVNVSDNENAETVPPSRFP
jgi:hypothetical protein